MKIICPEHGVFEQLPDPHLDGSVCPTCSGQKKHTPDSFIAGSREVHGDKFDYELVDYVHNKAKVKIACPELGVFEQTPNNHMNHQGLVPVPDGVSALARADEGDENGFVRPLGLAETVTR